MIYKDTRGRIILILLLSIMAVCTLVGCGGKKRENRLAEYDMFDEYVNYLLGTDTNSYDYTTIEAYCAQQEVIDVKNAADPQLKYVVDFVLGIEAAVEDDRETALTFFEASLEKCDIENDYNIVLRDYVEIFRCYLYAEEYENALATYKELIEVCDNGMDRESYIRANFWLCEDLIYFPDGAQIAIENMLKVLDYALETDYPEIASIYYKIASLYDLNDEVVPYINNLIEAIKRANAENDGYMAMFCLVSLSNGYVYQGDYDKAISTLEEVGTYTLEDKSSEAEMKAYALSNLAYTYIDLEDYEKALEYAKQSLDYIALESDERIRRDDTIVNTVLLSKICFYLGRNDEGKEYLDYAINEYSKINPHEFSYTGFDVSLEGTKGQYYLSIGDYNNAEQCFLRVEEIMDNSMTSSDYSYLYDLYNLYVDTECYEDAVVYLEKICNRIVVESEINKEGIITKMMDEFESEKKAQEIELLKKRNAIVRQLLFVSILFIIVCIVGLIVIFRNSKKLKHANELLKNLSEVDSLTGLYNRRALANLISLNWGDISSKNSVISAAMIDVDNFKLYNDNYGHQKGDEVLAAIGTVLKRISHNDVFAARYGGEEFVLIMPGVDKDGAMAYLNEVRDELASLKIPHEYSLVNEYVTISVGISCESNSDGDCNALIEKADEALYKAKETKNTIHVLE